MRRLLAAGLLRPLDPDTVVLPREVALRLRRPARLTRSPVAAEPPVLTGQGRTARLVDSAAAGGAMALLDDLNYLLHLVEETPRRTLRAGGVSARDVGSLARQLDVHLDRVSFVLEAAGAAGLVGPGPGGRLLPTADYDRWVALPDPARWHRLVSTWLDAPRWWSQSGGRGEHALAERFERPDAPRIRRTVLTVLAAAEPATTVDLDALTAAVGWHHPRLAASQTLRQVVRWTWDETAQLGLTALDATTSTLRAILAGGPVPAEVTARFPEPGDMLIIQADLTAVAPGPLAAALTAQLRLPADQESRGAGGTWRFSSGSLRRAFDAGWTEPDVVDWLRRHSTTEVPQPLAYLVADVGRQFGRVRVGTARSYLRVDDGPTAAAVLAHPDAALLALREAAPGLLVADADADDLVGLLRAIGLAPALDHAGGTVTAPRAPRAPGARPSSRAPALPDPAEVAAAIRAHSGPDGDGSGNAARVERPPIRAGLRLPHPRRHRCDSSRLTPAAD